MSSAVASVRSIAALLLCRREPARRCAGSDQYTVDGADSFAIGARDMHSDITYAGTQTLAIASVTAA